MKAKSICKQRDGIGCNSRKFEDKIPAMKKGSA